MPLHTALAAIEVEPSGVDARLADGIEELHVLLVAGFAFCQEEPRQYGRCDGAFVFLANAEIVTAQADTRWNPAPAGYVLWPWPQRQGRGVGWLKAEFGDRQR